MTTPLKVYVAGSSKERNERAIPIIKQLRRAGLIITHDWTVDMQQYSSPQHSDVLVPEETRIRCSDDDMNAIRHAHYVLLLSPDERGSSGAWTEFGFALGCAVPVIVTGAGNKRTIFTSKASRLFDNDVDGAAYLIELHQRRVQSAAIED